VFRHGNIAVFNCFDIHRIFTIRRHDEVEDAWEFAINEKLDHDEDLPRHWIEIADDRFEDILSLLPKVTQDIHDALEEGDNVYVHWYFCAQPLLM